MSTISTIQTPVMAAALGTPRDYAHVFAGVVSAAALAGASVPASAAGARKWGRPPREVPR